MYILDNWVNSVDPFLNSFLSFNLFRINNASLDLVNRQ